MYLMSIKVGTVSCLIYLGLLSSTKEWLEEGDRQTRAEALKKLGLSKTVINFIKSSRADPYNHQCDMYHVKRSIEEVAHCIQEDNLYSIIELCFEKTCAKELHEAISRHKLLDHQSLAYWMRLFVEYANDKENDKIHFQNNGEKLNEWFTSEAINDTKTFPIQCINLCSHEMESFLEKDAKFPLYEIDSRYWYHGTTQNCAESIRKDGIILAEGRPKQDFSHSAGFYLNRVFRDATNWAKHRFGITTGAVLIYKFQHNKSFECLDLSCDKTKWQKVVQYYRSGCRNDIPNAIKRELRNIDYIVGPISAGGSNERSRTNVPRAKHDTSQLCIKSEEMASNFGSELCGIIYFID